MKAFRFSLVVRLLVLAFPFSLGELAAAEAPPAPAHHLYDPDFLLSREAARQLSGTLEVLKTLRQVHEKATAEQIAGRHPLPKKWLLTILAAAFLVALILL